MNIQKLSEFTKTASTAVTAVGILALMATVGVLTVTKNHGMLFSPEPDPETGVTDNLKTRIVSAYDDNIVGFDKFLSVYGVSQKLLGTSVYEDAGYTYLIRDSEDYLHFHTLRADARPFADAVISLNNTLTDAGIPFLYLQAPTKVIEGYTKFPIGLTPQTVNNSKEMAQMLRDGGVELLSFSEIFAERGIAPETQFYRTDHHWTTQSAFEAFSYVVPYLNETRGWTLDETLCADESWTPLYQPQSFLGSIGRRVGQDLCGLDDYTYLEPNFPTSYQVFYPPESREVPYWKGDFHFCMVRDSLLYAEDVTANRYASYFQYDYGELVIENMLAENELHVVIVKDSFALPFTAFFSTTVRKTTMIDLREFDGSVTEYLQTLHPDLVIMLYGNGSFSPTMYQFND